MVYSYTREKSSKQVLTRITAPFVAFYPRAGSGLKVLVPGAQEADAYFLSRHGEQSPPFDPILQWGDKAEWGKDICEIHAAHDSHFPDQPHINETTLKERINGWAGDFWDAFDAYREALYSKNLQEGENKLPFPKFADFFASHT